MQILGATESFDGNRNAFPLIGLHLLHEMQTYSTQKSLNQKMTEALFKFKSGNDLLSHPVARAVPSALAGLTSLFGMGRGVSPPLWSPEFLFQFENKLNFSEVSLFKSA